LVRLFGWPVGICLVVILAAQLFIPFAGVGRTMASPGAGLGMEWFTGASAVAETLVTLANLVALGWFGLWMGLTSKNARVATLKTILLVQLVPGFVIVVAAALISLFALASFQARNAAAGAGFQFQDPLFNLGLTTGMSLTKDVCIIWLARRKLLGDFRTLAAPALAKLDSPFLPPIIAAKS
jgi:hypothetical protein